MGQTCYVCRRQIVGRHLRVLGPENKLMYACNERCQSKADRMARQGKAWWAPIPTERGDHAQEKRGGVRKALPVSRIQRFRILKRDGYRCQVCGAMASDGPDVRLQVDHKLARACGGTNDDTNLWVLCETCNRGKRAQAL
jgi:hypothetical protein